MMYANGNYEALAAMERACTGHYGEDGYEDTDVICPVCGAENPFEFYFFGDIDTCVGCTDCIRTSAYPDGRDW